MIKRFLALITAFTILLSMAVPAYAADGPCITASTATTYQGSSFSLRITAEQFASVGSVDFTLYYDADAFTVTGTSNGNMIDGSTNFQSENTNIAGQVTVSAVTMDAFSDSGTLLYIYFDVAMDCAPKEHSLALTVGNAYGLDLQPMQVSAQNGKVTVNQRAPETHPFYLGSYLLNSDTQKLGDTFTMRLVNNNYYSGYHMASGDFTVKYDTSLFRLVSAAPVQALQNENAVCSINTDIEGTVLISYASVENVRSYELFDLEFTVIGNVDAYSYIQYTASNVYDEDLFAYDPSTGSQYVYLTKVEEVVDHPDLWLEIPRLVVGQQITSVLMLEEGADVAAGDFVVTYDPTVLRCVSVTAAPGLSAMGGVVMVDDNFTDGTVEFPYINTNGYDEEDIPLVEILWEPLRSVTDHTVAVPSGSMTYNAEFAPVSLDYIPEEACIFVRTVIDPLCTVDGRTNYTCACGKSIDEDPVPMLGHDIVKTAAQAPTCLDNGWHAYESCTRGDYTTRVDIPALGHDEVFHRAKSPACTEVGWDDYTTCSRCDYSTYVEIPALGHRSLVDGLVEANPISVDPAASGTAFTLESGKYFSNNHVDGASATMGITALYDCELTLVLGVSSEQNYDKLAVEHRGQRVCEISGEVAEHLLTLSLTAGDTVLIIYQKDGSVSNGKDRGWAELRYDFVMVDGSVEVPSEELAADCLNPVVCHDCGAIVKAAIDHDYQAQFRWNDDHSVCQAELRCAMDCGTQVTVDCRVEENVTDPEKTIHVATADYAGKTFSETVTCDNHLILFQNWDGQEVSRGYYHLGRAVDVPTAPTRAADETYTYTFNSWDSQVTVCQGDAVYTATYTPAYIDYTVTFQNWDGSVLQQQTYHYGDPVVAPTAPTKAADNTYTYAFAGWDAQVTECCGNAVYTATYAPAYIDYTVTFKDWNGTVLQEKQYHYGDEVTAPTAPTKAADETYTYTFAGWNAQVTECRGSKVYTATYTPVYIDYTVTFQNWDGTVISQGTYHYGDVVEIPQEPEKPAGVESSYVFVGWDKTVIPCAGDAVYTAVFSSVAIDYTVTFQDWNGTVLQEKQYHYGDPVAAPTAPTKAADNTYTYTFTGWDKEVTACAGNIVYTAVFQAVYIDYTVIFQDWNGTVLQEKQYHYGDPVVAPTEPARAADNTYTYRFTGWDQLITSCAGNAVYTAVFEGTYIDYTVTFKDWNGAVLQEKQYHYGDEVTAPTAPTKAADETYTYTFAGWDAQVMECCGNAVYTATYAPAYIDYTVTFKDWNGTVLQEKQYHYGDEVTAPTAPTRATDNTYTYTFIGWDKTVTGCAGNAAYTAVFEAVYIEYTIVFKNADGTVLQETTYHYGDPVTAPGEPIPPQGTDPTWVFKGWDAEVSDTCEGNAVYTAIFAQPYPRGDMNCDMQVTDADAVYLLRHTLFGDEFPIFQSGDLNGDGQTTDADAIYLLRHTLFGDEFPLH